MAKKYVLKKPIEALQYTIANIEEVRKFVGNRLGDFSSDFDSVHVDEEVEGWTEVYLNDYIVKYNGQFTHYHPKQFKSLFNELEE